MNRCAICGRELTDPESVRLGIGPVCAGKVGATSGQSVLFSDDEGTTLLPGDPRKYGVVLERYDDGSVGVNVPRAEVYHSPTGLEWGYAGSGPADLALNTLLAFGLSKEEAYELHNRFLHDVIARAPREGGVIPAGDILAWIGRYSKQFSEAVFAERL